MRILVTGGLGYVGGRICKALAATGHQVRLTTRRSAKHIPSWAQLHEIFIMSDPWPSLMEEACHQMDVVIHLAALNEIDSARDPLWALEVNTRQTLLWLRAAHAKSVGRFIYFSTAHVYASPLAGRFDENSITRPYHPYAISHRAAEDFVLAMQAEKIMECLVFRLSNAIGSPADAKIDRWTLVANDLCRQVAQRRTITLKSSGLQQRDFIALSDVTRAVQHVLNLPPGDWGDGLYNLGSGKATSIFELASLISDIAQRMTGQTIPIYRVEPKPAERSDPLDFRIDKLAASNFVWKNDFAGELESSLRLCQHEFGAHDSA